MTDNQGNAGQGIIGGLNGLYDIYDFKPKDVNASDIFKTLSHMCRYGGRCNRFFSVAQHSVLVSQIIADMTQCETAWFTRNKALGGLCHDFAEAYLTDIIRPIKVLIPRIEEIERSIEIAIESRMDLGAVTDPIVKVADNIALFHEANNLGFDTSKWCFIQEVRESSLSRKAALLLRMDGDPGRWKIKLECEYKRLTGETK